MSIRSPRKTLLVGIAGGSCAGKTTLAEQVQRILAPLPMALIQFDAYYKPLDHLPPEERIHQNFDSLDMLDWQTLKEDLLMLKGGNPAHTPVYDFATHCRLKKTRTIVSAPLILIEGILLFAVLPLVRLLDVKIFLDVEADIRLVRRIERDIRERERTVESVLKQYLTTVRPMHQKLVEPSRAQADLVVRKGGLNPEAIKATVEKIRSLL